MVSTKSPKCIFTAVTQTENDVYLSAPPLWVDRPKRFSQVVSQFRDTPSEKATDWAAGYLPSFISDLQLDLEEGSSANSHLSILDYGCGKGAVAACLLGRMGVKQVHGCDIQPECLNAARHRVELEAPSCPFRTHLIVPGDEADSLPAGEFDGAMCNFVTSMLKTREDQMALIRSIERSLSPGAPFVMLVNNPATVGTKFASIKVGEKGKKYSPGQLVRVQMFNIDTGKMYFETRDRWWPVEHYIEIFEEAGFVDVIAEQRTLSGISTETLDSFGLDIDMLKVETEVPAVLAVRGIKSDKKLLISSKRQKSLDGYVGTGLLNY